MRIGPVTQTFLLCLLAGCLAQFVSVPPRWICAVWPPTGLALAAMMVWGLRVWPGALLAFITTHLIIALRHFADSSSLADLLFASFVSALISLVQLLLAFALVCTWLGESPALVRIREIFILLLLIVPVQSLVGAAIGAMLPITTGAWAWRDYPAVVFDWFRGNAIGTGMFVPILLAWIGEPEEIWRPRRWTMVLPLLVGLGLYVLAYLAGPLLFTASSEMARLMIELSGAIVLLLLTAFLLLLSGQSALVAEEADRRAADLMLMLARQREAELTLAKTESRLKESQRIARIGTWEWDPIRDEVFWSEELYRLFGYDPETTPPSRGLFRKAVHPDDWPMVKMRIEAAIAGVLPYKFDYRVVHPDGTVRVLHVTGVIDRDEEGRPVYWRGTNQDVTERVRAEEERRRLDDRLRNTQRWEALGQLAGGVAHDFNNLMAAVLGHATLAREQLPADSPLHELLEPIEQSAHHASSLCQQLLTFAGKGSANRGSIDLASLVNETSDLIRISVPRGIDLHIAAAEDLPSIEGDRSQIKQVLLNLVWNASEAIGAQRGLIEVRTGWSRGGCCAATGPGHFCTQLRHGTYVWLDVTDTGCGIPSESLARIFDPFFTTKELGRGLGLSAVAGIVRSHGGVVCVTSTVGAGTRIRVYLAAVDREPTTRTPPPVINTPRELPPPMQRREHVTP